MEEELGEEDLNSNQAVVKMGELRGGENEKTGVWKGKNCQGGKKRHFPKDRRKEGEVEDPRPSYGLKEAQQSCW